MTITKETPWTGVFGTVDQQVGVEPPPVPDACSGDGIQRTFEQCSEWAEKLNCELKIAKPDQLLIDIDTDLQFAVFEHQIKLLRKIFDSVANYSVTPSKQGLPHRHVVVELGREYPEIVRIAMQACLGSDPTRELLSVRRSMDEEENVVIFFEKLVRA